MSAEVEETLTNLSKEKWQWMSAQDTKSLSTLIHDDAVFVHMGATFTKDQELEVIRTGTIHYRHVDIHEISVRVIAPTAIVLTTLDLIAVVGGNEVTNPFAVTETYIQADDQWQLAAMAFTRLLGPP